MDPLLLECDYDDAELTELQNAQDLYLQGRFSYSSNCTPTSANYVFSSLAVSQLSSDFVRQGFMHDWAETLNGVTLFIAVVYMTYITVVMVAEPSGFCKQMQYCMLTV